MIGSGRIKGKPLEVLARAVETPLTKQLVGRLLRAQLGINELSALSKETLEPLPHSCAPAHSARSPTLQGNQPLPALGPRVYRLQDFADRYRAGLSPRTVLERSLAAVEELEQRMPSMNPFFCLTVERARKEASESEARHSARKPIGPWDGVVVPIKEELKVAGSPCRLGTQVMPDTIETADSVVVQRLRAAGAIILGTTVMTEFGMSTLGVNPLRNMPRNVHHPDHVAGGSSTGSAVAVALGLSPVAVGTDGGGSLRVPAAYNGVFALKPTYGRVPLTGHGAAAGSSVVHVGPLATSSSDLAEFLEIAAGPDGGDPASQEHREPRAGSFREALGADVEGLVVGIDESLWRQAAEEVAPPARVALRALEKCGVELRPVRTRLLRYAPALGYLTVGVEGLGAMRNLRPYRKLLGEDLRVSLAGLGTLDPDDYVVAQRIRGALRREVAALFEQVDALALPTTAALPPAVSEGEMCRGFADPQALQEGCVFSFLANLTGIPAGSAPVGFCDGLPVGLQLMAGAWRESTILALFSALERAGSAGVQRPVGCVEVLVDD